MNPTTSAIVSCLDLCCRIHQQLTVAKHNKKECRSLKTVILCIQDFLENLPGEGLSPGGIKAVERIKDTLESSQDFLHKVTTTGPLMSLLAATDVRQDIVRFSHDLRTCFEMLGTGEKLVRMNEKRMQALSSVQGELDRSKTLFTDKEMIAGQLRDTAAAAGQQHMHPEELHALMKIQLGQVDEVSGLSPDELLAEIQALQMEVLYGTDPDCAGKKKLWGSKAEEFLVQQICAACAPKAALANKPLTPEAVADPPDGYVCPISKEIMINPVILIETAQTYEASNIDRWLQLHNTCPATGESLVSKQRVPNYALKKSIQQWAEDHHVRLPDAPLVIVPLEPPAVLGSSASGSTSSAAPQQRAHSRPGSAAAAELLALSAQAAIAAATTAPAEPVQQAGGLMANHSSSSTAPVAHVGPHAAAGRADQHQSALQAPDTSSISDTQKDVKTGPGDETKKPSKRRWRCTRTIWAATLIALVVLVGVTLGVVGAYLGNKQKTGAVSQPTSLIPSPASSPTIFIFNGASSAPSSPSPPSSSSPTPTSSPSSTSSPSPTSSPLPVPPSTSSTSTSSTGDVTSPFPSTSSTSTSSTSTSSSSSTSSPSPPPPPPSTSSPSPSSTSSCSCPSSPVPSPSPTSGANRGWAAVSAAGEAGYSYTCGIVAASRKLLCWGDDVDGQINIPSIANASWATVSAGNAFSTCGILADSSKLRCWGNLGYTLATTTTGELGNAVADVVNAAWSAVTIGGIHGCGILRGPGSTSAGTLRCWGFGYNPTTTAPDVASWSSVSAGYYSTCGISAADSRLYCWGSQCMGACSVPPDVATAPWAAISAAGSYKYNHACGILAGSGSLRCWGSGGYSCINCLMPQEVADVSTEWVAVAAGSSHACGIVKDGRLLCWGNNDYNKSSVPADVCCAQWTAVAVSGTHTCGILSGSGDMRCWGDNSRSQLEVPTLA